MNSDQTKINCSNCGEEVSNLDKFCSQCGVRVNYLKSESKKSYTEKKEISKSKTGLKRNSAEGDYNKSISPIKLFYLTFSLLAVGLLIIYSAGVFDSPSGSTVNTSLSNDPHQGVDLQYLQRINQLEEEIKKNPDNNKLLELAHLLNDSGFKDKAIEKYLTYLKADPKNADVLVDLGVCYYEQGKYEDALRYMKEALKYQPKHQIAHLNIGIVSLADNKHDEAIEWWKKAAEINPNNEIGKRAQELIKSH
jgi:tetratricopeptide (TPR) repeat protein